MQSVSVGGKGARRRSDYPDSSRVAQLELTSMARERCSCSRLCSASRQRARLLRSLHLNADIGTAVIGVLVGLLNQITTARGDIEVERLAAPWAPAMLQERTARQNAQRYGDCMQRGWNLTRVLARHRDSRTRADCNRPQHRPPDRSARGDP
jgi:hypothetical protein